MRHPKLSIIIPVLNQKQHLQNAIESVINQDFTDYELIVIDGKSTDNSLDVIKKYESKISYWESSEDKNVYDAMNKGIALATGDIIGVLNADDFYANEEVVSKIAQKFESENIEGLVAFHFIKVIFVSFY